MEIKDIKTRARAPRPGESFGQELGRVLCFGTRCKYWVQYRKRNDETRRLRTYRTWFRNPERAIKQHDRLLKTKDVQDVEIWRENY